MRNKAHVEALFLSHCNYYSSAVVAGSSGSVTCPCYDDDDVSSVTFAGSDGAAAIRDVHMAPQLQVLP